jgi:predicted O-methyltransferase YrrM
MSQTATVGSADLVLRQIEAQAENAFLPIIGPAKGRFLAEEVRKAKPMRVLELGTLIGYSAVLMGKEMPANSELITIEIHREEAKVAGENIVKANIPAYVKIITGNALDVIPTLEGMFDFAFIDAEKSEYLQYLKLAEPKLHEGAIVFADNAGVFADQMVDYLEYVRNSGIYRSRYIQVGEDGVEISQKIKD